MRPALFIKLGGRIFTTRKGGKKKGIFIVTPETFDPINAGDLTMMLCFRTIGIQEANKQPSETLALP
jgi:hypothetical protein